MRDGLSRQLSRSLIVAVRSRRVPLLVLGATLTACGPTPTEIGRNVLAAAPTAFLVLLLVLAGLAALLRKADPTARVPWRTHRVVLMGLVVAALPAALTTDLEWYAICLLFAGSFYVGVTLLAWRIWRVFQPQRAWLGAPILGLITFAPAIPLAAGMLSDLKGGSEVIIVPWLFGGYFGIPAGVVAVLVLVEALVRRFIAGRG